MVLEAFVHFTDVHTRGNFLVADLQVETLQTFQAKLGYILWGTRIPYLMDFGHARQRNPINRACLTYTHSARVCLMITDVCPVLPAAAQGGRRQVDGAYVLITPDVISRKGTRHDHEDAVEAFAACHKCNSICRVMKLDASRQVFKTFWSVSERRVPRSQR